MTSTPSFMVLSDDGQWAYILDSKNDYLLRIDMTSGNLENRIQLDYQPKFITYIHSHNLLAISSTSSQSVMLLNSNTLAKVTEIPTTGVPEGLLAWDNMLYITEGNDNSITIYDLNLGAVSSHMNVGFFPHRLFQNDNQVYVTNRDDNTISIIQPGQLGVAMQIYIDGSPQEMAAAPNSKWLYVGNKDIGGLSVIDATSNQVSGQIIFGANPQSLAVVQ